MPNWCSTSYCITGKSEEVKDLYTKMRSLQDMEKPLVENGFGNTWLGCLVSLLGADCNTIGCRGDWNCLSLDSDERLSFSTETAWYRCTDVEDLIREKYPSLLIYFQCEESGMGIYESNDDSGEFFPDRFILYIEGEDSDYYDSEESLMAALDDVYGIDFKSMDDVEKFIEEHNDTVDDDGADDHIWLNEFMIVDC